tara:strand:- start:8499 stop:10601 length:2103 start_codon:yes stop_codon:yes gene_type:complete
MLLNLIAFVLVLNIGTASNSEYYLTTFQQAQPDTLQVKTMLEESEVDINKGDFVSARKKIKQAEKWSKEIEFSEGLELSALNMAEIYMNEQFYDSAKVVLEAAIEEFPDSKHRLQFYNFLGSTFRYKNENEKAIEVFRKALQIGEETGRKRLVAVLNQNLAVAYIGAGMKSEALNSYLISIEYAEAEKDTGFLTIAYNTLGDTYNEFGDYEQSEYYLNKSLSLAKEKNRRLDILRASLNLANLKSNLEEFDESLNLYNEALVLSKEVRPNTPPFQILYNMGNLSLKMRKPNEAISNFEESLGYCLELNIPQGIYYNYGGLGNAQEIIGDLQTAIDWHRKALEVAKSINSIPFIQETYQKLYELNRAYGDFENALLRLEEYKSLSDSLLDLDRERSVADLKNQLELNRQTEINDLLRESQVQQENKLRFQYGLIATSGFVILLGLYILLITIRTNREKTKAFNLLTKQREDLEKLNLEMNKLFAIIAHDLRTPLSSMQGILFLLKSGDLSKDEIEAFTNQIEDSVQKNIDVMEDLLSWAKEQMSGITFIKENLNIYDLIDSVISRQEYRSQLKEVLVQNQVDKKLIISADENALKLILRNLLSNSIKFTGSGDTIKFTSTDLKDRVQLCVTDSGVGMSKEIQDKVFASNSISFSVAGTKGEKGTGFGLSLIKEFVSKLGGTITIESEEGKGTKFCIELPKK